MTIVVAVLVDYGEGQYRMVFGVECYEGYHFNNQPSQNSQTIIKPSTDTATQDTISCMQW